MIISIYVLNKRQTPPSILGKLNARLIIYVDYL